MLEKIQRFLYGPGYSPEAVRNIFTSSFLYCCFGTYFWTTLQPHWAAVPIFAGALNGILISVIVARSSRYVEVEARKLWLYGLVVAVQVLLTLLCSVIPMLLSYHPQRFDREDWKLLLVVTGSATVLALLNLKNIGSSLSASRSGSPVVNGAGWVADDSPANDKTSKGVLIDRTSFVVVCCISAARYSGLLAVVHGLMGGLFVYGFYFLVPTLILGVLDGFVLICARRFVRWRVAYRAFVLFLIMAQYLYTSVLMWYLPDEDGFIRSGNYLAYYFFLSGGYGFLYIPLSTLYFAYISARKLLTYEPMPDKSLFDKASWTEPQRQTGS